MKNNILKVMLLISGIGKTSCVNLGLRYHPYWIFGLGIFAGFHYGVIRKIIDGDIELEKKKANF